MENDVTLVSILVIIFLFIPGFFFKRFYFTGQFTKQFGAGIFAERFITSIFWGVVIQWISIIVTSRIVNLSYNNIKVPIANFYTQLCNNKIPDFSFQNFKYATAYVFFTLLLAIILGAACHKVVRLFRIDVNFPVFRFTNYWNYYFKGDLLILRGTGGKRGKVISTDVDVIADDGEGCTRMYSGFLSNYTISHTTGELETIALTGAQRWSKSANAFKVISGDCLIIPYSKVINFNIRYNIKVKTFKTWQAILLQVITLIALLSFIAIFIVVPYYYYNEIGLTKTIWVVFLFILDWLFVMSMISNFFIKRKNTSTVLKHEKTAATIIFLLVIAIITFIIYLIL